MAGTAQDRRQPPVARPLSKSIGMNIRRDPKDNMRRKYVSDADLLGPENQIGIQARGTALERRADAEGQNAVAVGGRLQHSKARANGYRWPFPRVD